MANHDDNCNGCCPGPVGPMGPQGNQGLQGVSGHDGLQGQAGQQGLQGVPGAKGEKGDEGSQGVQGMQGIRGESGLQGVPGPQGQAGLNGNVGAQGPAGLQGVPGQQGIQGIPGDCVECPCSCDVEFAEVYSQVSQQLKASLGTGLAGGLVLFESTIYSTSNIDVSLAASAGTIKVMKAGWYDIAAGMTGTLNPIPAPLPVWTLSLFLNGVIVPGSTFSNVPISPAQASNEITADTLIHFNVGDVISLANTSVADVFLSAPSLGTYAQTNSAYLKIMLLKAD